MQLQYKGCFLLLFMEAVSMHALSKQGSWSFVDLKLFF